VLEKLEIRNFQAHDLLRVHFDPHCTVFIGPSDVGKSAVLRAIRWIATDRPLGDAFLRDGAEECIVKVKFANTSAARRKGQENEYRLNGQSFKAWGSSGPPEPVQQAINLGAVNFQSQHDAPFWFCLSPGEVGRELNQIVDLGAIDDVLGQIAARMRAARSECEVTRSRLSAATEEAVRYGDVPLLVTQFQNLEEVDKRIFTIRGNLEALRRALATVSQYEVRAKELAEVVRQGSLVVSVGNKAAVLFRKTSLVSELVDNAVRHQAVLDRKLPSLTTLETMAADVRERLRYLDELRIVIDEHGRWEEASEKLKRELGSAKEALTKEVGEVCPICGRPMKS